MNETANLVIECPTKDGCIGYDDQCLNISTYQTSRLLEQSTASVVVDKCTFGYRGNLCSNCIDGWGKTKDKTQCFDCSKNPNIIVQLFFAILLTVGLIGVSVRSALQNIQ